MLVLGIMLSFFGLGVFCWLLFTLAIYALPFFIGLTVAFAAFHSGAGVIGAFLVGCLAGGATLAIGQIAFATIRSPAYTLRDCVVLRGAGDHRRLSRHTRARPDRDAIASLAGGLRTRRRSFHRMHGLRPPGHVCPAEYRPGLCRWPSATVLGGRFQKPVNPGVLVDRLVMGTMGGSEHAENAAALAEPSWAAGSS